MMAREHGRSFVTGGLMLFLCAGVLVGSAPSEDPRAASPTDIGVLFQFDPGPTYGGVRWISPPTFTSGAQKGTVGTVRVKVRGMAADGSSVTVVPEWTATDPEMVTVTPAENEEFLISVQRAGESTLRVAAGGVVRHLAIKAKILDGAIRVEISQEPVPDRTVAHPPPDPGRIAAAEAAGLSDESSRRSYALGLEMGGQLKRLEGIDPDLVARGLRDSLAGEEPLLTKEEHKAAMAAIRSEVNVRQADSQKQLGEKNKKDGEVFLAANKAKEGVVTLPSGLQYRILKSGDGKRPTAGDTVVCHHRGTRIDGTEFDSSYKRNKPTTLPLRHAIKGWREALQLMPVGSRWQLFIPAHLAYGARGARPSIGPNQVLVFEVELLSIENVPRESDQRAAGRNKPEDATARP